MSRTSRVVRSARPERWSRGRRRRPVHRAGRPAHPEGRFCSPECAGRSVSEPAEAPQKRGPRLRGDGRRRATVYRLHRCRDPGGVGRLVWRTYPFLRLSGNWLERAGFGIGQEIAVEVGDGRLVIEAVG